MRGLILVPPQVRYAAGPLLGPALLAGLDGVEVLDLNAHWLRRFRGTLSSAEDRLLVLGDHAKDPAHMQAASEAWRALCEPWLPRPDGEPAPGDDPFWSLTCSHAAVYHVAPRLADSWVGEAWAALLPRARPRFVGVSVLWSGQVLGALAVSLVCKRRWRGIPVVWGGAHVTALAEEIASHEAYGLAADAFATGPAEETVAEMVQGDPLAAPGLFRAGEGLAPRARERLSALPRFSDLGLYGAPRLTLPVQMGRGCAYGRCAFCTYPAHEGPYRPLPTTAAGLTSALACEVGADLAYKDSYLLPSQFDEAARLAGGRVHWSASTRLVGTPSATRLRGWVEAGLRTVELGLESPDPATLRAMDKRQGLEDLERWLEAAAGLDLVLLLNVMLGFPGQSETDARAQLYELGRLQDRHPQTRLSWEVNLLQVQRRSPLGRDPGRFGVRITGQWPWSASLGWDAPAWRRQFERNSHELPDPRVG